MFLFPLDSILFYLHLIMLRRLLLLEVEVGRGKLGATAHALLPAFIVCHRLNYIIAYLKFRP